MATSYKVIAQQASTASLVSMLTVNAATEVIISSMVTICNRAASAQTYSVVIRPNNETLADKHYIAYSTPIAANATVVYTIGMTLDATDQIYIMSAGTDLSFTLFGSEIA
jgi:hypothetical protein